MSSLAQTLCNDLLPTLGQAPAMPEGIHDWLARGNFTPAASSADELILLDVELRKLVPAINFDYERFALSSRESYLASTTDIDRYSISSWPLLKAYYSAFFGAHAIMRGCGAGVLNVPSTTYDRVNALGDLHSKSYSHFRHSNVVYAIEADPDGRPGFVAMHLTPTPKSKGVHEGFWAEFCTFLNNKSNDKLRSKSADNQEFASVVEKLTKGIKNGNHGAGGLSTVRNEINYQHKHGAWFPTSKTHSALLAFVDKQVPSLANARLDFSRGEKVATTFLNTSAFISCTSFEISDYVASRSTATLAFGQKWRRMHAHFEKAAA